MRRLFIFLNILALALLLLSCLAAYITPKLIWQLSFIGFAFPVVLIINVLFVFIWLLKRDRFGLLPLATILLTWKFIHATFALNFNAVNTEQGVKVLSWNVKNFDLYNWSHNFETRRKMMELIKQENADVLCFQEFYSNNQLFHNLEYIRDTLGYKYCYFPPAVELTKLPKNKLQKSLWRSGVLTQKWGVATFSKYPIVDSAQISFDNSFANSCIYTDVKIGNKTLRFYNMHFQSLHLGYDDYSTLDGLEETKEAHWGSLKKILRKMKLAYLKRSTQVEAVAESIERYEGSKLVCGDFNDVPVSYAYNTVGYGLQDAFIEKGWGFGATFANRFSIFRIDYVLTDKSIKINSYRTTRRELSDHYPVSVTFDL